MYIYECVCAYLYLREASLLVQYMQDALWPRGNQLQAGVEVLEMHGVPLDLFCTVLFLQDTHSDTAVGALWFQECQHLVSLTSLPIT